MKGQKGVRREGVGRGGEISGNTHVRIRPCTAAFSQNVQSPSLLIVVLSVAPGG